MIEGSKKERQLLLLCWLTYICAYIGKYSYSANKVAIISYYGVTNAEAGLIGTLFFVAYGSSQIIHGILCKHYNQKIVVPACLVVCATINILFACDLPFGILKYLWLLNGLVSSVFWPCVILTLSNSLAQQSLDKAVVVMSTPFALGTLFAYGFGALFVSVANYHLAFLTGGVLLFAMAIAWLFSYDKLATVNVTPQQSQQTQDLPKKQKVGGYVVLQIAILSAMAIVCNFVKDGLTSWTSVLLNQNFGLKESASIILTLILSLMGTFGSMCAMLLHKAIKDFSALSTAFFVIATVLFVISILLFDTQLVLLIIAVFGLITLCMHAIANVITSMTPMYLRDVINAGFLSGFLNGIGYIGSALSDYGLGAFSDAHGWTAVVYVLFASCALPIVLFGVLSVAKRISNKKHAK